VPTTRRVTTTAAAVATARTTPRATITVATAATTPRATTTAVTVDQLPGLTWLFVHRGINVHRCDAIRLGRHATQLESLYRRCFTEPPWRETADRLAAFPDRLTRHLGHDGFDGLVAVEGGRLVGAVYGWPAGRALESGNQFDDTLAAAVTPAVADRLVAPALIVAELMVDPGHQQRGIGSTLLTRLTADWPSAWLCTHPDAPAAGMYRRGGWCEELRFVVDELPMILFTWRAQAR
jgi:predicted N-acetyltransferase YhbS